MGFFTKLAEELSTGSNAMLSMQGVLTSYDENTGCGTIEWARKVYTVKANPKGKYGIYEVFPYGVPRVGVSVLFNLDSTKTHVTQVVAAYKRDRGFMNVLEMMKEVKGE